ncbi:major facilitator superfamily domain-containing protein [Rhypophila decipiens]|uniref:Major facilitator superfamily domain-containing protein n=1 Tax=Rhypophila decipiens TaxID=261697 RepID=A0AAN6Y1M3_9PEZI|nr:major facilitator superfamily domain-containing protein [Rhypophila decipiens]
MAADETTPLLTEASPSSDAARTVNATTAVSGAYGSENAVSRVDNGQDHDRHKQKGNTLVSRLLQVVSVENRILFAGFLITLSFSFTQVPIFYVFYVMECQDYYSHHPPYSGSDPSLRCVVPEITASTALDFAVLGVTTVFCGTINLFVAGWMVKKVGPRLTLMLQTFIPAIRVVTQIIAVLAGGRDGINIFQYTQLITIIGGPLGYILVINIMAGEVVAPVRRTAVFGMLQGCFMLGQATGYLSGGQMGDLWGIRRPFEVACVFFLIATVYVQFMLPYISPDDMADGKKPEVKGIAGFFTPLRVVLPQKIVLKSGLVKKYYGVMFLCLGVFLGILATDYAPFLIQLYATTVFQFQQSDNGYLMSGFAFMRSLFLIIMFPRIIGWGRKWYLRRHPEHASVTKAPGTSSNGQPAPPDEFPATHPEHIDAPMGTQPDGEPMQPKPVEEDEDTSFDLFFLRWSLIVDGVLTMCTAFATQKWHIFLAAFALPLGSGSAPAAKGVITALCSSSQRADALSALTLIENIGRLATMGFFGLVFSSLAEIGKPHLTFYCNAAIAVIAAGVLLFSRFPPEGSRLLEDDGNGTGESETTPILENGASRDEEPV